MIVVYYNYNCVKYMPYNINLYVDFTNENSKHATIYFTCVFTKSKKNK